MWGCTYPSNINFARVDQCSPLCTNDGPSPRPLNTEHKPNNKNNVCKNLQKDIHNFCFFLQLPGVARAKFRSLIGLLYRNITEEFNVDKCFKDYGLVVRPEYRRLGIGYELFKTMEEMAKIFKIPAAVIVFNNDKSQALAAKLGYTVLSEINFRDFVDKDGKMIIPTLDTKVVQLCYKKFF